MVQPVNLAEFPNSSGWHVVHDPNNMVYKVKSSSGNVQSGVFTQRVFAEKHLYDYLKKMSAPPKPVGRPKNNVNS
tara:strand:+ start:434 stop:658 length:225 start_codon:yes stop_codon:yes gene_type:complete